MISIFFIFSVNMKVAHKCKEGVGCDKGFCLQWMNDAGANCKSCLHQDIWICQGRLLCNYHLCTKTKAIRRSAPTEEGIIFWTHYQAYIWRLMCYCWCFLFVGFLTPTQWVCIHCMWYFDGNTSNDAVCF